MKKRDREQWARSAKPHVNASTAALVALGAKFARYEVPGIGPTVTDTGRAISPGKTTRKTWDVRKRARGLQGAPLPIHMAVHPMALTRTPLNPGCLTKLHQWGTMVSLNGQTPRYFLEGTGLSTSGRFALVLGDGRVLGLLDDAQKALGWRLAANKKGVDVRMIDTK